MVVEVGDFDHPRRRRVAEGREVTADQPARNDFVPGTDEVQLRNTSQYLSLRSWVERSGQRPDGVVRDPGGDVKGSGPDPPADRTS
jgi:hypothetical protein